MNRKHALSKPLNMLAATKQDFYFHNVPISEKDNLKIQAVLTDIKTHGPGDKITKSSSTIFKHNRTQ